MGTIRPELIYDKKNIFCYDCNVIGLISSISIYAQKTYHLLHKYI